MRVTIMTLTISVLLLAASLPAPAQQENMAVGPTVELPDPDDMNEGEPQKPTGIPIDPAPHDPRAVSRAFGITLGQPLPLSSKQVQAVGTPRPGRTRYLLLFVPAPRLPYARYWAVTDVTTRQTMAIMGQTRPLPSAECTWQAFEEQILKLERRHGAGMRLGGGAIWRVERGGRFIDLRADPRARKLQIAYGMDQGPIPNRAPGTK